MTASLRCWFAPLCSALFGNEKFLAFLRYRVSTPEYDEDSADLAIAALTVLMGPFDLSPLPETFYITLLEQLVDRVRTFITDDDDLVGESATVSELGQIFCSALLTFCMGDEKRQLHVMRTLPLLVDFAEQTFDDDNVRFYDLYRCMNYVAKTNPVAHYLLSTVFRQ